MSEGELSVPSIAAVVVTFNRVDLLLECIDSILGQTEVPDAILLIDNASTDNTRERLAEAGHLANPIVRYHRLPTNTGGAGGFYEGLRLASEGHFDWVWLMDDDAEPDPDCLALLLPHLSDAETVLVSPAVMTGSGETADPHPHRALMLKRTDASFYRFSRSVDLESVKEQPSVPIDLCSFVGPCIRRSAIERVGLPKREFFINQDDMEYSLRLGRIGRLLLIPRSRIRHKQVVAANPPRRERQRTPFKNLWTRYFPHRNTIWMASRGLLPISMTRVVLMQARILVGVVLFDDRKLERLRFWMEACVDGVLGRFDNGKARRLAPPN